MATPKKIIMKDLELADEEIARLRKENKKLKKYYDRDKEELMESCYALKKENEELEKENKGLKGDNKLLIETNERLKERNRELFDENKELKAQIAEYDDLTEELDYRKREAKRLGWNNMNNKQEIHS